MDRPAPVSLIATLSEATERAKRQKDEAITIKETEKFRREIDSYYEQLHSKVTNLDTDIDTMLNKHEADFMSAFKTHMNTVYQQLTELKAKYEEEES
jgi:hypothetical protein